jgi:hypothetical protein
MFFQAFFLIFIWILGFWQVLSQWLSPFSQGSKQQDDRISPVFEGSGRKPDRIHEIHNLFFHQKMVVNLKNINTSSKQQKHFMNKL